MKGTPRRAEREIARLLSQYFEGAGFSSVERVPVLGREGPDISINEFGLVVDVKARKSCPISYANFLGSKLFLTEDQSHIAFRLKDCTNPEPAGLPNIGSVLVARWLAHMEEWTRQYKPDGISAIVLHRPGVPFGLSTVVILSKDFEEYKNRWKMKTQSR